MIGESVALANRHRGQIDAVGDVADGVNARHIGRRPGVDFHRADGIERDADVLKTEPGRIGAPAGRDQHLIDDEIVAVRQGDMQRAVALFDARRQALEAEHHARMAQFFAQADAHVLVEAAQEYCRRDITCVTAAPSRAKTQANSTPI